jgi:hypothetical protein
VSCRRRVALLAYDWTWESQQWRSIRVTTCCGRFVPPQIGVDDDRSGWRTWSLLREANSVVQASGCGHGPSLPSGVRRSSSVHDLLVLVHAEGSTAACCSSSLLADQSTVSAQVIRRVGVRQHDERVVDAGVTSAIYVDILREVLRDADDRLWHLFSSDDDADTAP